MLTTNEVIAAARVNRNTLRGLVKIGAIKPTYRSPHAGHGQTDRFSLDEALIVAHLAVLHEHKCGMPLLKLVGDYLSGRAAETSKLFLDGPDAWQEENAAMPLKSLSVFGDDVIKEIVDRMEDVVKYWKAKNGGKSTAKGRIKTKRGRVK
jgi:hypothetical protein